jgi:hypothetical protein
MRRTFSSAAAAIALATMLLAVAARPSLAACGAEASEVDVRCHNGDLVTALHDAVATDRPLLLPRGKYTLTQPLVVDYAGQANTGFLIISRGATIDGTAIRNGPVLEIRCSGGSPANAKGCFYFHQEGTLFVNANTAGYAVVIGEPDLSDAHNSIKIDHLVVNNANPAPTSGAVQLNYVLNADLFIVADAAGAGAGIDIEQLQFSVLRGAASATNGTSILLGPGYIFANTFQGLDLEASPVCISDMYPRTTNNTWSSPYVNCPTGLVYGQQTHTLGQMNWQLGGDVKVPYMMQ